ncbi:AP2 domain-containing protein [Leclercia sp. Marseille-Q4284]|uniref:AP2 domain-containing protein n=1 Tax=Leclercia sp. Marseille-Q4284 TaxID=2866582 RepID=UPI001CE3EF1F|nr:AP2 domain-containing protein [Leclercia sp. Marseille-Q4284]
MARTKAHELSNKAKGSAYLSGCGYKGVRRMGSKYGWVYEDGRTSQKKGGFDTEAEAAYNYDEFLLHYIGPNADTNQALGLLKLKTVLEIRDKIQKSERPAIKKDKRCGKLGVSGFKGVSPTKSPTKPFKAQIVINNKYVQIGTYKTAEEAARAYDAFVLNQIGTKAITNISLGLLPPIGETEVIKPVLNKTPCPLPRVDLPPVANDAEENESPIPSYEHSCVHRTPEEEREAQRLAALAMLEKEEEQEEEEVKAPEAVRAVPDPIPAPAEPAAPPVPEESTELILMTDADKLRARAEQMLRQAAELDAGNIKREAALQIDLLSNKVQAMQKTVMDLIDCCADFEMQLDRLKALLK